MNNEKLRKMIMSKSFSSMKSDEKALILDTYVENCVKLSINENQENEKNLKKPMQKVVSTEIETHEIRCVEQTSNFCVKYKVFKIIKE